jgi:pimeloyl-ACP methyl ester carboxylesterase
MGTKRQPCPNQQIDCPSSVDRAPSSTWPRPTAFRRGPIHPLAQTLTSHDRVVALPSGPLWPGSQPASALTWQPLVNDLIQGLDALHLSGLVSHGHSLGEVLTLWAAIRRPDLCGKLSDISCRPPKSTWLAVGPRPVSPPSLAPGIRRPWNSRSKPAQRLPGSWQTLQARALRGKAWLGAASPSRPGWDLLHLDRIAIRR